MVHLTPDLRKGPNKRQAGMTSLSWSPVTTTVEGSDGDTCVSGWRLDGQKIWNWQFNYRVLYVEVGQGAIDALYETFALWKDVISSYQRRHSRITTWTVILKHWVCAPVTTRHHEEPPDHPSFEKRLWSVFAFCGLFDNTLIIPNCASSVMSLILNSQWFGKKRSWVKPSKFPPFAKGYVVERRIRATWSGDRF